MRLKITAGQLLKAVNAIWPSVGTYVSDEKKYFRPILMIAVKGNMKLHAENRSTFSWAEVEAEVETEGDIGVPGGILRDIAKVVNEDSIIDIEYIGADDNFTVNFTDDKNKWEVNSASEDTINVFDVEDGFTFKFDLPVFKAMINETAPATGRSDAGDFRSPYEWGGIELKRELYEDEKLDVIRAATTDGHRIHIVEADIVKEINVETGDFDSLDKQGILVSKDIVKALASLPDEESVEVAFGMNKSYLILKAGGIIHGVRLLTGKFPPYEKIMEKVEPVGTIKINRKEFAKAVRSARIVMGDTVKISINKDSMLPLIVEGIKETGKGKKPEISFREIEGTFDGEAFAFKMNPSYLMDGLGAIPDTDEVELIYSGDKLPIVVKHPDRYFRSFIMPVETGGQPKGG